MTLLANNPVDHRNPRPLPAILCLHGYGTNGSILRYQLRHILPHLSPHFRFLFPNAPFPVDQPGPGATLAVHDDLNLNGPFLRWHNPDPTLALALGVSQAQISAEREAVRNLLVSILHNNTITGSDGGDESAGGGDGGGGEVVGILAFSQGVCLGTAVCLDPELSKGVRFAVFVCGLFPVAELHVGDEDGKGDGVGKGKVEIPCIHVRGRRDPWRGQGVKLYEKYFVGERARRVVEFEGAHEVPSRPEDAARVVEEILRVWKAVGGKV